MDFPDYYAEGPKLESESWKPVTLFDPARLYESGKTEYPIITDPQTGQQVHARVTKVTWIERNVVMRKGVKTVETKRFTVSPQKFKESLEGRANKLKESKPRVYDRLKEDGWFDFDGTYPTPSGGWPGVAGLPMGASLAYPPGPLTRQIYLQSMWEMQSKAFEIYNHYGVAHGAIETIANFVIGDGVRIQSKDGDDAAQAIWDEFEERVELQPGLPEECMMLCVNGELLWHTPEVLVEGKPGFVDFISKDPGTCWEIITQPDDIRNIAAYYFNYPTQYQIITKGDIPTTDYIVEMIPPEEMTHTKINVQKNEKRGRSDLLSALSDLKMLQDIMRYRAIKTMNDSAIILDRTIKGDDTDVSAEDAKMTTFLGPGTILTHNSSETYDLKSVSGKTGDKSGIHEELLSQIGNGIGPIPADYLSSGGSGSRASALTRTEPAAKTMKRRQKKLEFPIAKVYRRVIQIAKKYGRCPMDTPEECEVTFPEIAPENIKEKLGNLALAEQQEWITHEMSVNMSQKELDITNPPPYDEMMKTIADDRANDPQLSLLFQKPQMNPDTGALMPAVKPGQPAPGGASPPKPAVPNPNASTTQPNAVGKNQSQKAYSGDKMGLSNKSKLNIKRSMQVKREAMSGSSMGELVRFNDALKKVKESGVADKAPPKFPKSMRESILAQYPNDPKAAYVTMWAIRSMGNA